MQLIGMLDSPYVRRVAVSLHQLGLPFTHRSLSVFRQFDDFHQVNPVVKAPTLVCDDGTVLMDSTLILDLAEALAARASPSRSLMPADVLSRQRALRRIGLALAALEKTVQIVYERALRPPEMRYAPWIERVTGQLRDALAELEAGFEHDPPAAPPTLDQAGITAAVAWTFIVDARPAGVDLTACPRLAAWTALAEAQPALRVAPHGDGTYPVTR